jgi:GMP synthase PP-ATPase subunit
VLYPDIQRISFALVVEPQQVVNELIQREQGVNISGFVVESVLYFCETDEADEAFYLAAVLNAPEIDRRLGGLRRKEQKSHPHVAKKIFDVAPIPLYDASNEVHRRLAELGKLCTHRVQAALAAGQIDSQQNITTLRRSVRNLLAEPLEQIDRLVQNLLAGG